MSLEEHLRTWLFSQEIIKNTIVVSGGECLVGILTELFKSKIIEKNIFFLMENTKFLQFSCPAMTWATH